MPDLLFVYGTLHPDRAPAEIASVARRLHSPVAATVVGHRRELGEYPAVRLDLPGGEPIAGTLFTLPDDTSLLSQLDDYEGFYPGDPSASLFLRQRTEAVLPGGEAVPCWIYTYNHPLPSAATQGRGE